MKTKASKQALVVQEGADPDSPQSFQLVDTATGKIVSTGPTSYHFFICLRVY